MSSLSSPFIWSGSSVNPSLAWSMGNAGKGRFHIKFPLDLAWYREQSCTKFQSLRHHKERKGLQHEFLVLELTDGSVCRIERMGDPDARFEAISTEGTVACDIAQSFPRDWSPNAHLDTSDVVARITFPSPFDLLDMLRICRAIHEGEKTCNYTLQSYNCYFFALAIQAVLTALIRGWDERLTKTTWRSAVKRELSTLSSLYESSQTSQQQPFILRLYSLLGLDVHRPAKEMVSKLEQELCRLKVVAETSTALSVVLWHSNLKPAMDYVLCRRIRDIVMRMLFEPVTQKPNTGSNHTSRLHLDRTRYKSLFVTLLEQAASTHEKLLASKLGQLERHMVLFQEFQPQAQSLLAFTMNNLSFRRASEPVQPSRRDSSESTSPRPDTSRSRPSPRYTSQTRSSIRPAFRPIVSPLLRLQVLIGWLVYARMLALWVLQLALGLFYIGPLWPVPSPRWVLIVEKELGSVLSEPNGLDDGNETTSMDAVVDKVHALVHGAPGLTVYWNEWPWTHVYRPIRKCVLDLVVEEQVLQVTSQNDSGKAMSVSEFQERLLERIQLHSERVESFRLGNAAHIRSELEDKMSQVWALIRNNDDKEWELDIASGWLMQEGSNYAGVFEIVECLSKLGCKNLTSQVASVDSQPISRGGFGDVYRGKLIGGSAIALKAMRLPLQERDGEGRNPLRDAAREAHIWSKCRHPNVLPLLGLAEIHGDVKGSNVLVSGEGLPLLTDFGTSWLPKLRAHANDELGISLRWAAPERLNGSTCSVEADIYALGMTILEILTSKMPYYEKREHAVMFAVFMEKETPKRPEQIPPDSEHGDTLWSLLQSCWTYDPSERPIAAEVAEIMETITQEGLVAGTR